MNKNDDYNTFFGDKNNYHPNEISALYFEEYFKECHNLGSVINTDAYGLFKLWLNNL